jgi:toxin ParE1/3/4
VPVLLVRPRAREDLNEIWAYIAEDSESLADAFVDRLDTRFHLLARQPGLGRIRQELVPGLRSFPVGRYVIFYELISDGVAVVRVLHSARDLPVQFDADAQDKE